MESGTFVKPENIEKQAGFSWGMIFVFSVFTNLDQALAIDVMFYMGANKCTMKCLNK